MLLDENKRQKLQNLFINLYLINYSMFLFIFFLDTTMFKIQWPEKLLIFMVELSIIIIAAKMLLVDKFSKKELLLYIFLTVSFIGSSIYSGYGFLIISLILILGAKDVPFKKIIWLFCVITGTLLIVTMIASQFGLVENLIYTRNSNTRISFGFNYPTDFTAHIFFFVIGYCYLRKGKLTFIELFSIFGLSVFSYVFCDARTNALCLFITFVIFIYLKTKNNIGYETGIPYVMNSKFSKLLIFSMPICSLFIIFLSILYNKDTTNIILTSIDSILSGRIYWSNLGLERYGIHLFGSAFQMTGSGGSTTPPPKEIYFFLDSSYMLILIRYGFLTFFATIVIFFLNSLFAEKQNDIYLLFILALISIQCMIEHHLLAIAYNPFIFMILSEIAVKPQLSTS